MSLYIEDYSLHEEETRAMSGKRTSERIRCMYGVIERLTCGWSPTSNPILLLAFDLHC